MDDMKIFVPITKIDAAQRLVYGVVAEAPDVCGEVCDYATTKPQYQRWSQHFASASGGKSLGNLCATLPASSERVSVCSIPSPLELKSTPLPTGR